VQKRIRRSVKRVATEHVESEYVLHGAERQAEEDHLRTVLRRLDLLRNILLILALLLLLVPGDLTADWTPRVACIPLFLCILPVRAAGKIRERLGEEKKK